MTDDDKALVGRLFAMADEYDRGHHESWPTIDALEIAAHRIEALSAEVDQWRSCALYDATMEGPVFKGWDRSALERCRRAALGEQQ